MSIYPCQTTCKKLSSNFNTKQANYSMRHTKVHQYNMVQKTICNTRIGGATIRQQSQTIHQQVCSKFLFLGRAVDSTLLCPISAIALQSSKPTEDTMQQTLQLLKYLATQEDAVLSYHASNMVLAVHSDANYLSKPKA
jgi:hypothetical protein